MKKGLSGNLLKVIAVLTMLIDHIGVFFSYSMSYEVYYIFRMIGRISMPLYAFLIVQGYFHTSNLSKYLKRLGILGIVTQIVLVTGNLINQAVLPSIIVSETYKNWNVVVSFFFSLLLLKALDLDKPFIKKTFKEINILLRVATIILVVFLYLNFAFDYEGLIPIICIVFFIGEKFIQKKKLQKHIKNYVRLVCATIVWIILTSDMVIEFYALIDIILLYFYNEEVYKKSNWIRNLFYLFYPIHFIVLYIVALIGGRLW